MADINYMCSDDAIFSVACFRQKNSGPWSWQKAIQNRLKVRHGMATES